MSLLSMKCLRFVSRQLRVQSHSLYARVLAWFFHAHAQGSYQKDEGGPFALQNHMVL
jgi:hypothetical protein